MVQPTINGVAVCPGCGKPYSNNAVKKYNTITDAATNITWHKLCYDLRDCTYKQLVAAADETYSEDDWRLAIFEYLYSRVCLPNPDWNKIARQMQQYKSERTYKAIYYTLVYVYLVKGLDPNKAQGGIGILSYHWDEATEYWTKFIKETKEKQQQINKMLERRAEERKLNTRKKVEKPKRDIAAAFAELMKGDD